MLRYSKASYLFSILLAMALAVGCSKDSEGSGDDPGQEDEDVIEEEDSEEDEDEDTGGEDEEASVGPTAASCDDVLALPQTFKASPSCDYEVPLIRGIREIMPSCGASSGRDTAKPVFVRASFGSQRADRDFAFIWHTDADTRVSELRIGTSPDELNETHYGFSYTFAGLDDRNASDDDKRLVHQVRVCDLEPATTYYYQVGGDGHWSDVYAVATGLTADSDEPYRVAITGDTRNPTNEPWNRALESIHEYAPDLHLFTGDAVMSGGAQDEWDSWFSASEPYLAEQLFLPTNGNHEFMALNFVAQFALPMDGENYWVRYGNGLFIVFNDLPIPDFNTGLANRVKPFIIDALEQNQDATWRALINHRSMYSSSNHGSDLKMREILGPVIDEYGVDFVFAGHDHNFERTHPMYNEEVVADGEGTIYLVAAGIGAPLYSNGNEYYTAVSEKVESYAILDIDGDTATLRSYRLDGTLLDEYSITK